MNVKDLFDLNGKVALITGSSPSLGFQMAEVLGKMGYKAAITARKEVELLEAVAMLNTSGIPCISVVNDLSRPKQILAM